MRRAIWMALAFMGTAPLVALAQQSTGEAPAASPSGAGSVERGQDTTATQAPGPPGQQPAGSGGTTGPTYRGTTEEIPSASPPLDIGTRVGPEPGEQAGAGPGRAAPVDAARAVWTPRRCGAS